MLLPEKFTGKQSEGHGYEIKRDLEMVTTLVRRDLIVVPYSMRVEYCSIVAEQHNVEIETEGLLHVSATRGGSDYTMVRVVRLESSGEILIAI